MFVTACVCSPAFLTALPANLQRDEDADRETDVCIPHDRNPHRYGGHLARSIRSLAASPMLYIAPGTRACC